MVLFNCFTEADFISSRLTILRLTIDNLERKIKRLRKKNRNLEARLQAGHYLNPILKKDATKLVIEFM